MKYFKQSKVAWVLMIFVTMLFTSKTNAQCSERGVQLFTQADVNAFGTNYPSCTEIEGSLAIGSFFSNSDITDLSPLVNITTIAK